MAKQVPVVIYACIWESKYYVSIWLLSDWSSWSITRLFGVFFHHDHKMTKQRTMKPSKNNHPRGGHKAKTIGSAEGSLDRVTHCCFGYSLDIRWTADHMSMVGSSFKVGWQVHPAGVISGRKRKRDSVALQSIAPTELRRTFSFSAISLVTSHTNSPILTQFMFCQSCECVSAFDPWWIFDTCPKNSCFCVFFQLGLNLP